MGSKASFIDDIITHTSVTVQNPADWVALDVFMGSCRVAQAYRQRGFKTLTSEILPAGEAYSQTYICNESQDRSHLETIITTLNNLTPTAGWLTKYYGEAPPHEDKGAGKMVNAFTKENAMKADAIRDKIEELKPTLKHWEYMTLITSLVMALNKVQNSQGHSRAFFRDFLKGALQPLFLEMPPLVGDSNLTFTDDASFLKQCPTGAHFTGDVLSDDYVTWVKANADGKKIIAYLDPPYTTNLQYNLFYHLWDSVVMWDKPTVVGSTNRRADRASYGKGKDKIRPTMESLWSQRSTAKEAFQQLYKNLSFVDAILVSYSNESIITYDEMLELFKESGFTLRDVTTKDYQRHALSKTATASAETRLTAATHNKEWVFLVTKT